MKQGLIISQNYTRVNNVFIHKLKDKDLITNINQSFKYSNPFLISHLQHDILSNSACPFSDLTIILREATGSSHIEATISSSVV